MGTYTDYGFLVWVGTRYMLFATDTEYFEWVEGEE